MSTASPRAAPRLATALRKPLLATGSLRPKRTVRLLVCTRTSTATSTIRGYETTISSQRPRNNTPLTGRSRNYPSHTARVERDPRLWRPDLLCGASQMLVALLNRHSQSVRSNLSSIQRMVGVGHHTKDKGDIGLACAMADLLKHNIQIALPV